MLNQMFLNCPPPLLLLDEEHEEGEGPKHQEHVEDVVRPLPSLYNKYRVHINC